MSTTYEKAPNEVGELASELIDKYHPNLSAATVKIDYIFAHATLDADGNASGPALSHQGYPADGLARIIPIKDRVMGRGDCEIVLDGDKWKEMGDEERLSLLDHELEHFQLKLDKYGGLTFDDAHRPKMKMKKHDRQFGWFDSIARRWGRASGEIRGFTLLYEEAGQIYFTFTQQPEHV